MIDTDRENIKRDSWFEQIIEEDQKRFKAFISDEKKLKHEKIVSSKKLNEFHKLINVSDDGLVKCDSKIFAKSFEPLLDHNHVFGLSIHTLDLVKLIIKQLSKL